MSATERPVPDRAPDERESRGVRVAETRCPYCHAAIERGEEPVSCPACHAAHHEPCLREDARCGACGAVHPRFASGAPPAPKTPVAWRSHGSAWVALVSGSSVPLLVPVFDGSVYVVGWAAGVGALVLVVETIVAGARHGARAALRPATLALLLLVVGFVLFTWGYGASDGHATPGFCLLAVTLGLSVALMGEVLRRRDRRAPAKGT